jgi:YbbR domain-containing protein
LEKSFFKNFKPSRKFYVFIICLILSCLFWFLNVFNKNHQLLFNFPVSYINIPSNKVIINELPSHLTLKLNAHGFNLISKKFISNDDTLQINCEKVMERNIGSRSVYYITPRSLLDKITEQLNQNASITEILTDTIFFEFDTKTAKSVSVYADIDYSLEKQYLQSGDVEIEPVKILVTGPSKVIDTMQIVKTQKKEYKKLNNTVNDSLTIINSKEYKFLSFYPDKINIKIPVEKFTEGNINLPIQCINLPDSLVIKLFPESINVSYLVAFSKYEKLTPELFKAIVDYKDVIKNPSKLKVEITKFPEYINLGKITPERVEYIIKKGNA